MLFLVIPYLMDIGRFRMQLRRDLLVDRSAKTSNSPGLHGLNNRKSVAFLPQLRPWLGLLQWTGDAVLLAAFDVAVARAMGEAYINHWLLFSVAALGATQLALIHQIMFVDLRLEQRTSLSWLLARTVMVSLIGAISLALLKQWMAGEVIAGSRALFLISYFVLPSSALRVTLILLGTRPAQVPGVALVGSRESRSAIEHSLRSSRACAEPMLFHFDTTRDEDLSQLRRLTFDRRINTIILAVAGMSAERISASCLEVADLPVRISVVPDPVSLEAQLRIGLWLHGIPSVEMFPAPPQDMSSALKRGFDILGSAAALLLLAPCFAIVALLIYLESGGPVLFRQRRYGLGGEPVKILKFRTMHASLGDATGAQRTAKRDPRVTRVGRFLRRTSIDELPQLWNVLRGDMSLVGPRPHAVSMLVGQALYNDAVPTYRARHRVRPGITGWAQVNGSRGEIDTQAKAERRIELDLWYIDNWSLALDLQILLRTLLGGFASLQAD
ncbi:exopolysaccharide biosynthesis polyprenyl glycosylphosphotransferase [Roseomonas sp. E05]|uniref:exopolysaccharide biosynthesis polyprenyl glycosylphosphotransferase n=1 Tax=Roseomonas sp. E05 TaxID=3046310 RepID=UPI0024BBD0CC|nr:exopolysaccharide biosynthesis polyprenyl glycosylphosphotransferase [Roseomonas sp. E05]MDJ0390002.1 exopolysaccharide biosynthesis polyprenyl glycosylphosphotransferase [Roseomonas sp. E05]